MNYHYKQLKKHQLKSVNDCDITVSTISRKPDLGIQQNMQEVLNMCEAFFFHLIIKIKQKNDRAKAHVSRLIFNCNLSVRLNFMELQSCDKTYLL